MTSASWALGAMRRNDILHGQTGYEEVEVNSRGRVIRQLKEVPPRNGHDIYLRRLDLQAPAVY